MNIKGIKAPVVKSEAGTPAGYNVLLQPASKSRCLDVLISVENAQRLHKLYNWSQTANYTSEKRTKRTKNITGQRKNGHWSKTGRLSPTKIATQKRRWGCKYFPPKGTKTRICMLKCFHVYYYVNIFSKTHNRLINPLKSSFLVLVFCLHLLQWGDTIKETIS